MLNKNMNLKEMLDFKPSNDDMMALDLSVVIYIKLMIVSRDFKDNNNLIKHIMQDEEFNENFVATSDISFYEFKSKDDKCLTITELFSKRKFEETTDLLKTILEKYNSDILYTINLYTHDDHHYILHNLEGYINIEESN